MELTQKPSITRVHLKEGVLPRHLCYLGDKLHKAIWQGISQVLTVCCRLNEASDGLIDHLLVSPDG